MTTKSSADKFTVRPHISQVSPVAGVLVCTVCVFIKRVMKLCKVVHIAHLWLVASFFSWRTVKRTHEKQNICISLLLYLISVLYTCLFIHLLHLLQEQLDKSLFFVTMFTGMLKYVKTSRVTLPSFAS